MEPRGKRKSLGNPRPQQSFPRKAVPKAAGFTDPSSQFPFAQKLKGLSRSFVITKKALCEPSASICRPNRPKSCARHEFLETWWLEVSCCVLFVSALVAIVVTIYPYEGRPLPRWPYRLSINTLISIYVVVLKAAMLLVATEGLSQLKWRWFDRNRPLNDLLRYDDASRGPWGALMLVGWLRGRQWTSSCGAFITVAALVVDPFAQQTLSTYDCRVPAESVVATIPQTNVYNRNSITLELQNSINGGIFNPGRNVAFDCPTGNCTFPNNYHTVGLCSSCIDTTKVISNPTTIREGSEYLLMKSGGGKTDIIVRYLPTNTSAPCAGSFPSTADRIVKSCNCESPALSCAKIGAVQCSLFPCVKTYTAAVNGGDWTESLVSVSTSWGTRLGTSESMVNVECLNARDHQAVLDAGYDLMGRSWIPFYGSSRDGREVNLGGKSMRVIIPSACIYHYGTTAGDSINTFLTTYLNGTIGSQVNPYVPEGPAQLHAIYNNGNVTFDRLNETWRNLSESITTYMREHGMLDSSAPATGQAFRDQTCVHIRWPFLAYPAFLVLFAIVFFICMIFETRRRDTSRHDWKSSPLPLLFHGLHREALQTVQSAELVRAGQMEEFAERTSVRLSQTEGGWLFVGTQNASLEE